MCWPYQILYFRLNKSCDHSCRLFVIFLLSFLFIYSTMSSSNSVSAFLKNNS
ncbi:hypothetical protein O3M35_008411 [Rhynocoris fuscipes]|uniref:Uncharacterized protein n=1 Tax=Rhynocoris fuscipes TaxID=488301 RepID=A0AAW1DDL5_9HEMI